MTQFLPGVVEIGGKRCLVIADVISSQIESGIECVLLATVDQSTYIYCHTQAITEARQAHPGLPVYGYWQTLFENERWTPKDGICAYQNEHGSGQYVQRNRTTTTSGEVRGGVAIAMPGETVNADEIEWLDIETTTLKAPKPAMTWDERAAQKRSSRQQVFLRAGAGVVAAFVGIILGTVGIEATRSSLSAQQEQLEVAIEQANVEVGQLSKTRLLEYPNQQAILRLLGDLSYVDGLDIAQSELDIIRVRVPWQQRAVLIEVLDQHQATYQQQLLPDGFFEVMIDV